MMATLQRSGVSYRRQGSSGIVWDTKYCLGEDGKVEMKELRPCHTVKESTTFPNTINIASPTTCPRSLSTPQPFSKVSTSRGSFLGVSWKPATALKTKSNP
ncbi:hypothetical protein Pint_12363 [Pistacia integerrima]|uniref:Uncharacterized protein n=2 Tax=Pistacia TaxID=55512 RepID=A0ACC1AXE9_9ROSI|nr:hypothetical protein Pint_12363 [Pistacia integerrima]KAJ0091376.1 hypothetical protein Patl1_12434 [Pistacia atlantica]